MYHIVRTKSKQFQVVLTGKNGEVINQSEILKTKQSVWENLSAVVKSIQSKEGHYIHVQDETLVQPLTIMLWNTGRKDAYAVSTPPYVPGKNPKKKK